MILSIELAWKAGIYLAEGRSKNQELFWGFNIFSHLMELAFSDLLTMGTHCEKLQEIPIVGIHSFHGSSVHSKKIEKNMSPRYPISSFPNGWYAVATRADLQKGKVLSLQSLGRDLVAFQTESGAISVLDAHCPHQGAHLGHGGTIKGETIECPFHKWCFDTAGKCQKIPYSKIIPKTKKAEIHAYPTIERLGMILIYYSNDYSPPTWDVPQFADDLRGNWTNPTYTDMTIKTHIQELAENGFDVAHFQPVHGSEENSIDLDKKQPFGPQLLFALNLVYPGSGIGKFGKKVAVRACWRYSGLGVFDNHVTLRDYPMELRQFFFFTPLDEEKVRIQVALCINKDKIKLPKPFQYFVLKLIEKQNRKILINNFEQDRPIWENKKFREPPILCEGDGPITHLRTWMKQFYTSPVGELRHDEHDVGKPLPQK